MSAGRRLSGPRPSHDSGGHISMDENHVDNEDVEITEPGTATSNIMRGSNIPAPLPVPTERPMIGIYANEFAEPWPTWGVVPPEKIDQMFLRFKQLYQWDPNNDELIRKRFMKHASYRWNGMLNAARKRAIKLYEKQARVPFDNDYSRLTPYAPTWMREDCWVPLLLNAWNTEKWKATSKRNKDNRNTSAGGNHTCGARSFVSTRKKLEKELDRPIPGPEFFTHCHAISGTKPLDELLKSTRSAGASGSSVASGSAGVGESDGIDESDGVGSSVAEPVQPVWVCDKARDHIEKYKASMVEIHGEDVDEHPFDDVLWNKISPQLRGNTYGAYNASDPIFVLTGTPSTPSTATSCPPNQVEVLKKSLEELEQAREDDKRRFEEDKEEERKLYEEKLRKVTEDVNKGTDAKLAEMWERFSQQNPPPPTT